MRFRSVLLVIALSLVSSLAEAAHAQTGPAAASRESSPRGTCLESCAGFAADAPLGPTRRWVLPPSEPRSLSAADDAEIEWLRPQAARLSSPVRRGAIVGGVIGAAFGLAVVSFADCSGSGCTSQRVIGVAGLGIAGAAAGALVGSVISLVRR